MYVYQITLFLDIFYKKKIQFKLLDEEVMLKYNAIKIIIMLTWCILLLACANSLTS